MDPPRIDVLLPAREARRTLPSAVGDVLGQRDVDVRVIAVADAASPDDATRAWLAASAASEPRLVAIDGPGEGPGPALDLALLHVTAPLVALMEADDRCPPDRLRRLYDHLQRHPHLAGVVSRAGQIGARTPGMRRYLDWQNALVSWEAMAAERFVEIPALFQSGLYRRQALWAAGGFRARGPWPIDIDFWFRWFAIDLPVEKVPRVLFRWRQHAGQSTRGGPLHDLDHLRACKVAALVQRHGRASLQPRPIVLVATGATRAAWERDLRAADVELICALDWRPGQPAPAAPPPRRPPGAAARWGAPLWLAAYGMPAAREALREALGRPREPDELLFCA